MSQDWRKKLEENFEAERQKEKEAAARTEREEYARKVAELARKFKCHVCGARPTKPLEVSPDPYGGWGSGGGTDWDRPGDLYQCYCCNKWTCEKDCHLVNIGYSHSPRRVHVCRDHVEEQIREYSPEGEELIKMGIPLIISIIVLLIPWLLWSLPMLGLVFAFIVWYIWGNYIAENRTKLVSYMWGFILLILVIAIAYGVVTWASSPH